MALDERCSRNGERMVYQWYLFDLDGTLTDPKEGLDEVCAKSALKLNVVDCKHRLDVFKAG